MVLQRRTVNLTRMQGLECKLHEQSMHWPYGDGRNDLHIDMHDGLSFDSGLPCQACSIQDCMDVKLLV